MEWADDAREAVSRVPFFVRKKVRRRVEEEAAGQGATAVTIQHVRDCQNRFLQRMEEEVNGFQVESCFGSGGCPNRALISENLVQEIRARLVKRDLKIFLKERVKGPLKLHHEFRVSISDCPNACSRPQIVDIGVIGASRPEVSGEPCEQCGECVEACMEKAVSLTAEGPVIDTEGCLLCGRCIGVCPTGSLKEAENGYRILIGGKLGRHPKLGRELEGIHSQKEVVQMVDHCLDHYTYHCVRGERFGTVLETCPLHMDR